MKNFFKKNSNTIAYCVLFGIALSVFIGPLGTGVGIALGAAVGQYEDKKSIEK
ncbi:hypothetical protein ABDK10_11080 [Staphylococcus aureus]